MSTYFTPYATLCAVRDPALGAAACERRSSAAMTPLVPALKYLPSQPQWKHACPLSGHDLMAMFPYQPSRNTALPRQATTTFFHKQEHAFFARPGPEILRVRFDDARNRKASPSLSTSGRFHPYIPTFKYATSSRTPTPETIPSSFDSSNTSPNSTETISFCPGVVATPTADLHPPPSSTLSKVLEVICIDSDNDDMVCIEGDDDDDDEAWRYPIPVSERRRAGMYRKKGLIWVHSGIGQKNTRDALSFDSNMDSTY